MFATSSAVPLRGHVMFQNKVASMAIVTTGVMLGAIEGLEVGLIVGDTVGLDEGRAVYVQQKRRCQ